MTTPAGVDRAVVIGGGIAGLLAARVLADHYATVLVLDRDELPQEPVDRGGVPQGRHSHGLLARGRAVMEDLLPGLTDDLVARGAGLVDVQATMRVYVGPRSLAAGPGDLRSLRVSRRLLEWYVRERVCALPGVEVRDRTSVLDLLLSPGRSAVVGVVAGAADDEVPVQVPASLVVDASGRTSRTPAWLVRHGLPVPPEERVRVDVGYVTRRFARAADHPERGWMAVLCPAMPGVARAAVALPQEDGALTVSVAGYRGEQPPTDLDGFVDFARSCASPAIADLLGGLEPLDDGVRYRFAANRRTHYERATLPAGLVVVGDALCAFDPVFGQGMTVAALECLELARCLRAGRDDLARRFHRSTTAHLETPWTLVTGSVRRLAEPTAPPPVTPPRRRRPPSRDELVGRYVRSLQRAATDDPILSAAFFRVVQLVAPPPSLLAPRYAVRVARSALRRPLAAPFLRPVPPRVSSRGGDTPETAGTSHTDVNRSHRPAVHHHPPVSTDHRQEATPS